VLPALLALLLAGTRAHAADPPQWLREQVGASVPQHDAKAVAVMSYSATVLSVQANGRIKRLERVGYRILRPEGEELGVVRVPFDAQSRITAFKGWSIPPEGKPYEVKEKDALDSAVFGVEDAVLMSDQMSRMLQIPNARPGSVIGYEVEQELRPYVVGDAWDIQETVPVRESHYTLQLPPGWEYRANWVNSAPIEPVAGGKGEWHWNATDIEPVHVEKDMPPWRGIGRRMRFPGFPPARPARGSPAGTTSAAGTWASPATGAPRRPRSRGRSPRSRPACPACSAGCGRSRPTRRRTSATSRSSWASAASSRMRPPRSLPSAMVTARTRRRCSQPCCTRSASSPRMW
jgi:hypothetical protein